MLTNTSEYLDENKIGCCCSGAGDLLSEEIENQVIPNFEIKKYAVIKRFFSRDAKYWSFFDDANFIDIVKFRKQNFNPINRIDRYPDGKRFQNELMTEDTIPEGFDIPGRKRDDLLKFTASM